jgi:hypothetical protein
MSVEANEPREALSLSLSLFSVFQFFSFSVFQFFSFSDFQFSSVSPSASSPWLWHPAAE